MEWKSALSLVICLALLPGSQCKVKVSFELDHYENLSHRELDGDCCDAGCGSCDNRFNLCFDVYNGNNDMSVCSYGRYETDRLFENNDNFDFPDALSSGVANPIVLTFNTWPNGFRSKVEVWDRDPKFNPDDKIDYYGYNYGFSPDRSETLATVHTVVLDGAGYSLLRVKVKVYCAQHYYGTSSGCDVYCVAQDNSLGHYDCNDFTGAKDCHPGWTGSNCAVEINECDPNPCLNGGVCTDLLADYSCNCPAGTEGKNCDNTDECASNPCEHGGTCTDQLNYYLCTCTRLYSGTFCEFEIDFCSSDPCQNGATCKGENDAGQLVCECAPGYSGEFCLEDIDECSGVTCQNNGTCGDGIDEFTCYCPDGYSGVYCEMDVRDECASNPCKNNASCVDEVGGYICVCPAGFESENCQENIDECETDPCMYGNCTDMINRYRCECFPGYAGENCTQNIDECLEGLCQNNSTCRDGINNFTCSCLPGYSGDFCHIDIDECASSPCQNGGSCDDSEIIDDFSCHCPSGYVGQMCELDVDECTLDNACPPNMVCVNLNGSFACEDPPAGTTPIPGDCRPNSENEVCYNEGTCEKNGNTYRCVCPSSFTGAFCETPTESCSPNPCQNGGFCRVNTAENGSVSFECSCVEDFTGTTCSQRAGQISGPEEVNFPWWIIIIVILLIAIVFVVGCFIYRHVRNATDKPNDGIPVVFANPHANAVSFPTVLGPTSALPLPPKKILDEEDDPHFVNNMYSDIDGSVVHGAVGLSGPYTKEMQLEDESPYATGAYGYMPMSNGHASGHVTSPRDDSHYEYAPDHVGAAAAAEPAVVVPNMYSTEPTLASSVRRPFGVDSSYSTTIFPVSEPPPPLPLRGSERNPYSTKISSSDGEQPEASAAAGKPSPVNLDNSVYILPQSTQDEAPSTPIPPITPTSPVTPTSPGNPFRSDPFSAPEAQVDQPSTPTSVPSTPSSPNNPDSTETFNQSDA